VKDRPLVSCVIPVYNGERYLAEAIASVLAQTYRPIELIVVDDGSTDGSAEVARSYDEVRYIYQPNRGVAVARNVGVEAARGDFIAFLDQDDVWMPNKLDVQVGYLIERPNIGYVVAKQETFLAEETVKPGWLRGELLEGEQTSFNPSALVVRKSIFERVGGFYSTYRVASDSDWFFRVKDAGVPMAVLDQVLLRKRVHDGNESRRVRLGSAELLEVVGASIRRQGRNGPMEAE